MLPKNNSRDLSRNIEEELGPAALHNLAEAISDALAHRSDSGKIVCATCGKPATLETDMVADENGKLVHEDCYLKRVIN
jgi:hypothetical protein